MMRRNLQPVGVQRNVAVFAMAYRRISTEHKAVTIPGAPTPPMIPQEPVVPIDFNPHIEWFEFPKEIFDPIYPYTREECLRMVDERLEMDSREMAEKYGVFVNQCPRFLFWLAYTWGFIYLWFYLWSAYRAVGSHPKWNHWTSIVRASPDCPTLHPDEIYLDLWTRPDFRQRDGLKTDMFWQWKTPTKEKVFNPWKIEVEYRDPKEWKHMTSRY